MPEAKKATTKKATTKKATSKTAVKKTTKKATDKQAHKEKEEVLETPEQEKVVVHEKVVATKEVPKGRYIFATGRRKTAVANVKLFEGKGDNLVNKKDLLAYFGNSALVAESLKAFKLTGNETNYYFTANVQGGGSHAQATAVRHGAAKALSTLGDEVRKVLKKNGLLTRDPREKERKKPGLKRARRAPQWAKR